VEQLNGLEGMFLHAELHGMPMHISSLSIYDPSTISSGKIEFKKIIELFERKVQYDVPVLRYKVIEVPLNLDQPYLVEDHNFDLVYHVRHIALPRPCNWQKLCSLTANLHAQPLNRSRPLWEAYIIDGLDNVEGIPSGCFAVLLKVHHSIMDGRIGMAILDSLHSLSPCDVDAPNNPMVNAVDEGKFIEHIPDLSMPRMLARATINNLNKSVNLLRILSRSPKVYSNIQQAINAKEFKQLQKPKTRFNGKISPRRVVDRIRLPMIDIAFICSNFPECTIDDITLSTISGALRNYLIAKDELPEDSLVAAVPMDISGKNENQPHRKRVNVTNISLRTDVADSVKRLCSVHHESNAGKAYAQILGKNITSDVMDSLYVGLVSWGVRAAVESGLLEKFPPANNTIVANVQGSTVPLYLCGAKLIESFGMGPLLPNTGLFHTVSSTYDFVTIAFTADRQKMDDPDFYVNCLTDSFSMLLAEVKFMKVQQEKIALTQEVPKDSKKSACEKITKNKKTVK
jgi:diacylglycerol O-acyltransferase